MLSRRYLQGAWVGSKVGQLDNQVVTAIVHLGHKVLACTDSVLTLYCHRPLPVYGHCTVTVLPG